MLWLCFVFTMTLLPTHKMCVQERGGGGGGGRITETNYPYSIISPPILVAKSNQQKGPA